MTDPQDIARAQSRRTEREALKCLDEAFRILGRPESLLDIGCGDGHFVWRAIELGVDAVGVDIGCPQTPCTFRWDLRRHWYADTPANMVLCLEVAEHLPMSAASNLVLTLRDATVAGGILLFSAATPGQGGSGHVNEQPHDYWKAKLLREGFEYRPDETEEMREAWERVAPNAWWYGKNVMVFGG